MVPQGVRRTGLAKRVAVHISSVDRMLNGNHNTHLCTVEKATAKLANKPALPWCDGTQKRPVTVYRPLVRSQWWQALPPFTVFVSGVLCQLGGQLLLVKAVAIAGIKRRRRLCRLLFQRIHAQVHVHALLGSGL